MNDSLFQSTIVHLSQKTKKTQLQHYIIPQHNAKQLYDAYQGLLSQQENKEKVIQLMEKAGMTHIHKFYDGPCKYEGLHIPGPGLCWRNVITSSSFLKNTKVVLIETNFQLDPIHWYFIELKENMTSSSACAALLIDRMMNSHNHSTFKQSSPSSSSTSSSSTTSHSSSLESNHSSSNESSSSSTNPHPRSPSHHNHHHHHQRHLPFSFHSLLNKSKNYSFFPHSNHHRNDTLLFIIGCPLPIQANENEPVTYLG
ncbi:unnamed protein product [Cunninghamella blakesleeana]